VPEQLDANPLPSLMKVLIEQWTLSLADAGVNVIVGFLSYFRQFSAKIRSFSCTYINQCYDHFFCVNGWDIAYMIRNCPFLLNFSGENISKIIIPNSDTHTYTYEIITNLSICNLFVEVTIFFLI
jgi:hypothetical protein